jgi:ArsR family transcriptional regulator
MEALLSSLRAAAEPTRLRLLVLCGQGEITVGELTEIIGQSQPMVSRHLKQLCGAGLLERFKEGKSVFYRRVEDGAERDIGRALCALVPAGDAIVARDGKRRLAAAEARAAAAASYFSANAKSWDELRSLYVEESEVEAALLALIGEEPIDAMLDIGTGTGRMLQLLAGRVRRGIGVDLSRDMLAVARSNLQRARVPHCHVRLANMYSLPLAGAAVDMVMFHQVLHFADRPAAAIVDAVRVLRPGGRMVIVDFAPHELEYLRAEQAHRRLGFSEAEVASWCRAAGAEATLVRQLPGKPLTVNIWLAARPATALARSAA